MKWIPWACVVVVAGVFIAPFASSLSDAIYIGCAVAGPLALFLFPSALDGLTTLVWAGTWLLFCFAWTTGALPEFGSRAEMALLAEGARP